MLSLLIVGHDIVVADLGHGGCDTIASVGFTFGLETLLVIAGGAHVVAPVSVPLAVIVLLVFKGLDLQFAVLALLVAPRELSSEDRVPS